VLENTINPTSASQRIDSSLAFFTNPLLLLENVTWRLVELSILRITIFPLPIFLNQTQNLLLGFFLSQTVLPQGVSSSSAGQRKRKESEKLKDTKDGNGLN